MPRTMPGWYPLSATSSASSRLASPNPAHVSTSFWGSAGFMGTKPTALRRSFVGIGEAGVHAVRCCKYRDDHLFHPRILRLLSRLEAKQQPPLVREEQEPLRARRP